MALNAPIQGGAGGAGAISASDLLGGRKFGGRLTLTTAVPVTTADVTAAGTLYYTPFISDQVVGYDGTSISNSVFTEVSLDISALLADTNYDITINSVGDTLTATAWTNGTTRATALTLTKGVNIGASNGVYLGTIRMTGTVGECEDSEANRLVWNAYNRVERKSLLKPGFVDNDTTTTWSMTSSGGWFQVNGGSGGTFTCVIGLQEDSLHASGTIQRWTGSSSTNMAIGHNTTSDPEFGFTITSSEGVNRHAGIDGDFLPIVGLNTIDQLEQGSAAATAAADVASSGFTQTTDLAVGYLSVTGRF